MHRKVILFYSSITNIGIEQKKIVENLGEVEILLVDICNKNLTLSKEEMIKHYGITERPTSIVIEDGIVKAKLEGLSDTGRFIINFNDN